MLETKRSFPVVAETPKFFVRYRNAVKSRFFGTYSYKTESEVDTGVLLLLLLKQTKLFFSCSWFQLLVVTETFSSLLQSRLTTVAGDPRRNYFESF